MTTPAGPTISIADLNTEFGYGNSLGTYRYMYNLPGYGPCPISHLYSKTNTKRGVNNFFFIRVNAGQAAEQIITNYDWAESGYSLAPQVDGCPYGKEIAYLKIYWAKSTGRMYVLLQHSTSLTLPQNYFAAFHIPSVIWLDTANAATFSSTGGVSGWQWSGYPTSPIAYNTYYDCLLER